MILWRYKIAAEKMSITPHLQDAIGGNCSDRLCSWAEGSFLLGREVLQSDVNLSQRRERTRKRASAALKGVCIITLTSKNPPTTRNQAPSAMDLLSLDAHRRHQRFTVRRFLSLAQRSDKMAYGPSSISLVRWQDRESSYSRSSMPHAAGEREHAQVYSLKSVEGETSTFPRLCIYSFTPIQVRRASETGGRRIAETS